MLSVIVLTQRVAPGEYEGVRQRHVAAGDQAFTFLLNMRGRQIKVKQKFQTGVRMFRITKIEGGGG